jgi:ubiquitin carboxyl-terminal hydrolase 22/27/51
MCFYVKKRLEYKPYVTPTYVKAREMEAAKEKEKEKEKEREQAKRTQEVEVDAELLALL